MTEFSIGLQTSGAPSSYGEIARRIEDLGLDGLSVFNDLGFPPPVPALLAAAEATRGIRLGVACFNASLHHPVVIAGQFAQLHRMCPGRAYLGITRGAWSHEIGLRPACFDRFAEAIDVARYLLAGRTAGYHGEHFQIGPGFRLNTELPAEVPPLLLGVWGPRGAELATRSADEVKLGGCANPAMVRLMRTWLASNARGSGVGVVAGAVTVVNRDRRAARRLARTEVAMYLDVVAPLDRTAEVPADLRAALRARLADGDRVGAGALIPDDVLDLFCFAGTPDDIACHASELIAAGAGRIEFGPPHGIDAGDGITLLGKDVVPAVRAAAPVGSAR